MFDKILVAGLPFLAIRACGCGVDLIDCRRTGWFFEPSDPKGPAGFKYEAERQSLLVRAAMQQAACQCLEASTLESFSAGLCQSAFLAQGKPRCFRCPALIADLLSRR